PLRHSGVAVVRAADAGVRAQGGLPQQVPGVHRVAEGGDRQPADDRSLRRRAEPLRRGAGEAGRGRGARRPALSRTGGRCACRAGGTPRAARAGDCRAATEEAPRSGAAAAGGRGRRARPPPRRRRSRVAAPGRGRRTVRHRHGGGSPGGQPLQLHAAAAGPRRARRTRAMKRWFARLPIHRKLVVMALLVTTTALLIAGTGLVLVDLWRFRSAAHEEATATARVLAENAVAAVA